MRIPALVSRLPGAVLIFLGLTLYFLIGWPLLGLAYPDLSEAPARAAALLLPMPIFAFMAAWTYAERCILGRRLVERLPADPYPKSRAQRHTERRASFIIASIALFISLTPIIMGMTNGERPGLSQFAPALVWGWMFHVFGRTRMRLGALLTMPPKGRPQAELDTCAERLLLGLIFEHRRTKASIWEGRIDSLSRNGAPFVTARVWSNPKFDDDFEREEIELPPEDEAAFMAALTGDADRYRLAFYSGRSARFDLDDLSHHARMMGMNELHTGRAMARDLLED